MFRVRPIFLLLGAIAVGLAIAFRKDLFASGRMIIDASKKGAFLAAIPARARTYADAVIRVAGEEGVSPFILVAIMERETQSGTAKALDKPGPGGRGDFGHGHGLMQIDDRSFGPWLRSNNWADPYVNIKKGAQVYKGKLAYIRSKVPGLSESEYVRAAIAAYNTGEGNVVKSLKAGRDVDSTTAHGNYSADVLTKIATAEATFKSMTGSV